MSCYFYSVPFAIYLFAKMTVCFAELDLSEILMMIRFWDIIHSHEEVCRLFNLNHSSNPMSRSDTKCREYGYLHDKIEFCKTLMNECDYDSIFSGQIRFPREAIFYLNGHLNSRKMFGIGQTKTYYQDKNIVSSGDDW